MPTYQPSLIRRLAEAPPPTLTQCPTCGADFKSTEHMRTSTDGSTFKNRWHHTCKPSCGKFIETEGEGWKRSADPMTPAEKDARRAKAKAHAEKSKARASGRTRTGPAKEDAWRKTTDLIARSTTE